MTPIKAWRTLEGIALRACLVKVRVRMVSYAVSYEKAVSDRPFRHRVDCLRRYRSQNTKSLELVFRALLTDGAPEVRFKRVVAINY